MGQFDQLIAQELMRNRSQRGDDPNQRARDFAARQMNARDGGPSSTAWPSEQAASRGGPAVGGGGAAGGGEIQQKQVPIPMSRPAGPMDAAIDEQMGNPQLAAMQPPPAPPLIEMGDARVAEMMSPMNLAIAQQVGEQQGPPMPAPAPDGEFQVPVAIGGGGGSDVGNIAAIAASLGGAYGVKKLLDAYQSGDPDAANFFKSSGIAPDDLSMFADDLDPSRAEGGVRNAPAKGGKQTQPSRARPSPNQVQKQTQKPRSKPEPKAGNPKVKPKIGPDHPKWKVKK